MRLTVALIALVVVPLTMPCQAQSGDRLPTAGRIRPYRKPSKPAGNSYENRFQKIHDPYWRTKNHKKVRPPARTHTSPYK